MIWIVVKLVIRFAAFGLVFGLASRRSESVAITPRWCLPMVALVFALLNTGIYWIAEPVLNLATLGMMWFLIPFILNGCFLYVTGRILSGMGIDMKLAGILSTVWLAAVLTAAHGALYLALDVLL